MWTVPRSPACAKAGHWNTDMDMDVNSSSTHVQHEGMDTDRRTGGSLSHSRSQSWSLPVPDAARRQTDFSSSITSMYSISPISTVIRDFVPSFVHLTRSSDPSGMNSYRRMGRNSSTGALGYESQESGTPPEDGGTGRDQWTRGDVSINMEGLDERRVHEQAFHHEHVEQSTLGVEISEGVRWMEHNAVFIIILLIKFSFYHRYGLMIILGMFGTFFHCNQVIRKQVALKNRRHTSILIMTVLFLASNIFFVYYVFWDKHLYNCLYFRPPQFTIDSTNLLWSIWVTDYIVKFATMALKALVATTFIRILPSNKKGRYYMLLEYVSHLYRNIIPAPLWVRYLSNKQPTGIVFAVVITSTYLMIKGVVIFLSVRDLYRAIVSMIKYPLYEVVNNGEGLIQCGNMMCPICQEDYQRPVALNCRHVFCEDCVLQWLDRQNSCPMCRAAVPNHNPKWRDGSTSSWPQLF